MLLSAVFERFLEKSPVSVLVEGTLQNALHAALLDELLARTAQQHYTRHLLFSTRTDLTCQVACGVRQSSCAAHQACSAQSAGALTRVYNKRNGVAPPVAAERVRHRAARRGPIREPCGGTAPAGVKGYRTRRRAGNHRAATQHRLCETRAASAAPRPGQALVVSDPRLGLAGDVCPGADGHAQERSLRDEVVATVGPRDRWLGDRNFCVRQVLLAIRARGGCFALRGHAKLAWEPAGQALRGVHGQAKAEEVSGYYLADESAGTRRGLLSAIPEEHGAACRGATPAEMAEALRTLASKVRLAAFRRHRRGDKKPPVKRT